MSAGAQQLVAIGLIAASAVYLGIRAWRALRRERSGCGADCGCGPR